MNEDVKVRVFIESESRTIQAADMDTVGHPLCTNTNSSDWVNSALGEGGRAIPQEHLILLDVASRAAEKLGLNLEIIDISKYSFFQKRKLKGRIPRIEIGEITLTGLPTSDEIVERVRPTITA
jgi:hypothetical protein